MAFKRIEQPNVEITQKFKLRATTPQTPLLTPFIFGVCREIVDALDSTGSWNSEAKSSLYTQLPIKTPYLNFPSPRGNIKEVTIESDYIRVFHDLSAQINELSRTGNFFCTYNNSCRPLIQSDIEPNGGWDLNPVAGAKTLVIAIDQPVPSLSTKDVSVTFTSTANALLTTAQVATQINTAVGKTVAYSIQLTGEVRPRLHIYGSFGAAGSVTIRGGASANSVFGFNAQTERVEGSGFRGQDDQNSDTKTPWIEWFRGAYYLNGTEAGFPGSKYLLENQEGASTGAKTSALTFDGNGLEIKVGDIMWADGVQVKEAVITKVETSRFRLGTVNTNLSTYDSKGNLVIAIYDLAQVNLLTDPVPFAPKYAWFRANNVSSSTINTAAVLTGSVAGTPATAGSVEGSAVNSPFALTGLSLRLVLTEDGVEKPEQVFTFAATYNNHADVVTAFGSNVSGVVMTTGSNKFKLSTVKTGANQAIKVIRTGTANSALGFSLNSDVVGTGTDPEFVARAASVATSGNTFPLTLANNNTLVIKLSTDGGSTFPTTKTHTSSGATYNTIDDLVTALAADNTFMAGALFTVGKSGDELVLTTVATGDLNVIKVDTTSTAIGANKIKYSANQLGRGADALNGKTFEFQLNKRPHTYSITFQSNSLVAANNLINDAVGYTIASIDSNKMKITSTIKGCASYIKILQTQVNSVRTLGFLPSNDVAAGTGRPTPELVVDSINKEIKIDGELLRHVITGLPYDPATTNIYIQYRGVRKDITALATKPELLPLTISNRTELDTIIGPVSVDNPLALGVKLALDAVGEGVTISCMGIDEISGTYPEGTPEAYNRLLEFSETQDVYFLAPLTGNKENCLSILNHTYDSSLPKNGRERICMLWNPILTRAVDTLVSSGAGANTVVGQPNILNLDVNPTTALLQKGINTAQPIPVSSDVFVQFKVNGTVRNYNIQTVNGIVLTLRTSFAANENTDGFYSTTALTETVIDTEWSLFIRGTDLKIIGTTLPDKQKISENIALHIQTNYNPKKGTDSDGQPIYAGKRISYIVADDVEATVDGIVLKLPAYYASAYIAALESYIPANQPLTNLKLQAFTNASKTARYFKKDQLEIIAGGGGFILLNDKEGLPVYPYMQLTTDTSTIESRERSITKAVDVIAKIMRERYKLFLDGRNITDNTLTELGMQNSAIQEYVVKQIKLVRDLKEIHIGIPADRQDTIEVDFSVLPYYALNYIKVTLYI